MSLLGKVFSRRSASVNGSAAATPRIEGVTRVDLGCGGIKKEGCFGVDKMAGPAVDYVMDLNCASLPFADNSIEYVYSSHAFEHFDSYAQILRELIRVCKHDALVEIWTPYGPSRDAFVLDHKVFLNETHWRHWCYEFDRFWLADAPGYFLWEESEYHLRAGVLGELRRAGIELEFAISHMFDISHEWCVRLRVKKDAPAAPGPQEPRRVFSCGRGNYVVP
jgi:SAM-dependent methyltransferase